MSYQELPVQMHTRYAEFLAFMADCPHRKTPSTMETAFWAWLELTKVQEFFNSCPDPRDEEVKTLKKELEKVSALYQHTLDCNVMHISTNVDLSNENKKLRDDLDRLHRERDSFQEQARCLAESSDTITDYAIFQAISDLERVCRHRTATQSEDWLQIEAENRTHIPTINYALEVLKACGVEMDSKIGFPNIRIIYDRSNNKFFGKS